MINLWFCRTHRFLLLSIVVILDSIVLFFISDNFSNGRLKHLSHVFRWKKGALFINGRQICSSYYEKVFRSHESEVNLSWVNNENFKELSLKKDFKLMLMFRIKFELASVSQPFLDFTLRF